MKEQENEKPWGWHLMLDCKGGDKEKVSNKEHIRNFVSTLIEKIDMIPFGDLMIERFATHDEEKAGISFCQMIETSNISGHFVDKNGNFFLDIFSCKGFNTTDVIDLVHEYFEPEELTKLFLSRGEL